MKFDVIIGNPPYQHATNLTIKLWIDFLEQGLNQLNEDGTLSFVTPSKWFFRPEGNSKRVIELIKQYQLDYVDSTTDDYFTVGEKICSYQITKTKPTKQTRIKTKDGEKITKYTGERIAFTREQELIYSIYKKFEWNDKVTKTGTNLTTDFNVYKDCDNDRINKGIISRTQSDDFPIKVYSNINKIFYTKRQFIKQGWRCCLNMTGYWFDPNNPNKYMPVEENIGTFNGVFGILVPTKEQALNARSYYSSKLFRFVVEMKKGGDGQGSSGFNMAFRHTKIMDWTKPWTDEELYQYFNLTQEEINLIEEKIS